MEGDRPGIEVDGPGELLFFWWRKGGRREREREFEQAAKKRSSNQAEEEEEEDEKKKICIPLLRLSLRASSECRSRAPRTARCHLERERERPRVRQQPKGSSMARRTRRRHRRRLSSRCSSEHRGWRRGCAWWRFNWNAREIRRPMISCRGGLREI